MSFWEDMKRKLGKSLGLLGKPYLIPNLERKFGSANEYFAIQLEWPHDIDDEKLDGEEVVALFTPHELERALKRANDNPEDIDKFLRDHAAQDAID